MENKFTCKCSFCHFDEMLLNNNKYLCFHIIVYTFFKRIFMYFSFMTAFSFHFSSLNYEFVYYSYFNYLYFSAVKQGTDMLELDLHMTKDEKVVVSHDNNLLRVTGIDVNISDLNYKVSLK